MTNAVRAVDLPAGSIVAEGLTVYVKEEDSRFSSRPWASAHSSCSDAYVDAQIEAGADVLRHGYGSRS